MVVNAEPTRSSIDIGTHLQSLITSRSRPELVGSVIPALTDAIAQVADKLRESHQVSQVGSANAFGDDQLNVDLISENLIRDALTQCPAVVTVSSEEDPVERSIQEDATRTASNEQYTVAFDPLDGSSIIAANWTVGTIIGIWDGPTALHTLPRQSLIASIIGIYGPRTTILVALNIPDNPKTCFEVGVYSPTSLNPTSSTTTTNLTHPSITLHPATSTQTHYFSPANLRAASDHPAYAALINHYITSRYTLRYSGGLVPDIAHILTKGQGIYISPTTATSPAKLRRLYELCPIALVVECAGGRAVSSEDGEELLGRALEDVDERAGLVCGSPKEVEAAMAALLQGRIGEEQL
jgi:sedoheptulose-bisphosphatase